MATYSPQYIAESFVKQYYEIFTKSPADLYKFYLSDASFAFTDVNQVFENVVGMESIRHRVSQLGLLGSQVSFSQGSVDAQRSEPSQILVVVTGTLTTATSFTARPFTNTFILVGKSNSYFVSNSVFRFVAVPPSPAVSHSISSLVTPAATVAIDPAAIQPPAQRHATEILKSVIEPVEVASSVSHATNPHVSNSTPTASHGGEANREVEQVVEEVHLEPVATTTAATATVEDEPEEVEEEDVAPSYEEVTSANNNTTNNNTNNGTVSEAEGETTTAAKSYSDIVKRLAAKTASSSPSSSGIRIVKSRPPPTLHSNNTTTSETKNGTATSKGSTPANQQFFSVYITSLPDPVNESDIATLFSRFGVVTQVDLARGRKYGFVKFETVASMQAALDNQEPLELNGVRLTVDSKTSPKYKEEKRSRPPRDRDEKEKRFHKSNGDFRKEKEGKREKEEGKTERREFEKSKANNNNENKTSNNKNKGFPRK